MLLSLDSISDLYRTCGNSHRERHRLDLDDSGVSSVQFGLPSALEVGLLGLLQDLVGVLELLQVLVGFLELLQVLVGFLELLQVLVGFLETAAGSSWFS